MALFFPPSLREGAPKSEDKVWSALSHLGDDWRVFHSVVWQGVRCGKQADGEADFVLLHPAHGMAVLEVKGGGVEVVTGEWHTTDRDGIRHKIKDPFTQAKDSKYTLLAYLKSQQPRLSTVPRICHGVVFPDIVVKDGIGLYPRELVLDLVDMANMARSLERLVRHWNQYGVSASPPAALQYITDRLAPTVAVKRSLVAEIAESERNLLELTRRQFEVLRTLRSMRRCVVRGGAGTGKTLLAMEKARSMAAEGARALYCCYNGPLAERVRSDLSTSGVDVLTFHAVATRHAKAAGIKLPSNPTEDWWDTGAAQLLAAGTKAGAPRFDAIVVDEAQDFSPEWIHALDGSLHAPGQSPFYLFTDDHQQLYRRGRAVPLDWPLAELDKNCRNTRPIASLVSKVFGDEEPRDGAPGQEPVFMPCEKGEESALTQSVVDRLISEEGIAASQLAVLCERRDHVNKLRELLAAGVPFVEMGQKGIVTETVHRFKGLEAAAVVLVLASEQPEAAVRYVGASRARSLLVIIGKGARA